MLDRETTSVACASVLSRVATAMLVIEAPVRPLGSECRRRKLIDAMPYPKLRRDISGFTPAEIINEAQV